MARHAELRIRVGLLVSFCDPQSPWQRGTNENNPRPAAPVLPKGTDLSLHGPDELEAVADALNGRPRRTLGWRTPAEAPDAHLLATQDADVATTA